MSAQRLLLEDRDPDGRRVALDAGGWRHILEEHPEMALHQAAVLWAVAGPDCRDRDPRRPGRERFWRMGIGPSRWLFVVVDFSESPARVVTAFARRDDPPGWWMR
jgi:hypothetical protein